MTYAITILPTVRKTADHCARGRLCARGWELHDTWLGIRVESPDDEAAVLAAWAALKQHRDTCEDDDIEGVPV